MSFPGLQRSLQGDKRSHILKSDVPNAEDANSEAMEQLRRLHDEYEAYISHAKQTGAHCEAANQQRPAVTKNKACAHDPRVTQRTGTSDTAFV